jgi:hypothetical protein
LSAFELGRYLDYCGEMLSVLSKVAALYAQAFPEPVVLSSVDQIETLTSGLSTKIDLKLSRLDRIEARFPELAGAVGARADEKRVAAAPHQPEAAKASAARGGRALVMAPQPGTAKTSDARGGRALVMAPQPETAKTSVALGAPPRTAAPGSGSPAPPSKPLLDAPATAGAASGARRRLPLAKAPSPRPQAASDGRAAGEAKDD